MVRKNQIKDKCFETIRRVLFLVTLVTHIGADECSTT